MNDKKIAFIGLGNMGGPMAANLVKAGFEVAGFDLSKLAQMAASKAGISLAESAAEAVKGAGTLMTMLPAGKHVIGVWAEVLPHLAKCALVIEFVHDRHRRAHGVRIRLQASKAVSRSTHRFPEVSVERALVPLPLWLAVPKKRSAAANKFSNTWARASCIVATPARVRRPRSAIT